MTRLIAAAFACAALLPAQTKPVTGCADLRSLTNNEVSIAIALAVEGTANSPAHCRVGGQILPQVGFELRLPPDWNGSFVMYGNGGFAGEPLDGAARIGQFARALRRGYAVAATD